jgi:hypothetical protein
MNPTTRIVTPLLVLALLVLAQRPAFADPRSLITGGKGVGSFQLGKKFTPYSNALGQPTKVVTSEVSDNARMVYYKKYGMYFFVKKDVVNGIQVESPLFATPEGIHVGSERMEVLRTYGQPQALRADDVTYPERGLAFSFRNGKVARIIVVDKEDRDLASGDRRIVPGVRVGGLEIGQPVEFVLKQWKNPSRRAPFPNKQGAELWSYPRKGVIVITWQGRIDGIWIFSPEFRTIRDIHVGSKRDDVIRAYGKPKAREDNMESYPDSGMGYFYEKGVVKQIYIKDASKS